MRRRLWFLFLFALPLFGQQNIPTWQYVSSAPSGACSGTPPIQMVYSTGAMWGCISGTWTQINGGASSGALFPATNGLVKNTSTTTAVTATGTRDGTGDYQLPIVLAGAGGGLSCALAGNTWTCTLSGGAGTGAVNAGAANQMGEYPAAGTTIGPSPHIYAVDPAQNASQVSALFASLSGSNTVILPAGTPQAIYATNGQVPYDLRLGASYFQMPGAACDGKQSALSIPITQGSNTSNVGATLTSADVGKTFFFFKRTGYTLADTQNVWAARLQSYAFPTATWTANAPFTQNQLIYYGTDNWDTINNHAMAQANSVFPLTVPTGCLLLVTNPIQWNNNQVIVGRSQRAGGFVGPPGKDVISTVDSAGNSVSSAGTGLKGLSIVPGTEVDATLGYNSYAADGTLTVVAPLYRPAHQHGPNANHPCAPGWMVNCINSVGALVAGSASMTVPAGVKLPAVGNVLVFPYLAKVFTTAADAVNTGSRVVTMHAAAPTGSTQSQAEFFAGTSVQTTTTSIPGTPTYPFALQLTNSINPVPGWPSNFAQHGTAKIQDFEFEYMGGDQGNNIIMVRRGPATVNGGAGYPGTNTIVPLNYCEAKNKLGSGSDQPWPVTPSINAGDSTPSGANWFAGECIGNAAIAFPVSNGNTYVGSGLVGGFIEDIDFAGSAAPGTNSGNANNVADIYQAGDAMPFASHFANLITGNIQYGIVQGAASSGQHGVAAVGPTGIGNTYHNLWLFAGFPLAFVDMQSSDLTDLNMNSAEISPYDGTPIGSATCVQEGFTLDEQTGGVVTSTQFNSHKGYACEPENGSHIEIPFVTDIQSSHASFDTANFEGIPNLIGGDHFKCTNCLMHLPLVDYGVDNDYGVLDGSNSGYITNIWDPVHPQFLGWGQNAKCSMFLGGTGPAIACGASTVQGYEGRGPEASVTGSKPYFALGGMITPWMWDANGMFDTNPFTQTGTPDPTASYWGASSRCALGSGASCHSQHFAQSNNGFVFIGPFNQFYDGPYLLDATFKSASASSSFTLTIRANDSGSGQCTSGGTTTLFAGTVNTTTSYTPFKVALDMTGHAGCVLDVTYAGGSTTDTILTDRFNFVPVPQQQLLRVATLTPGTACGAGVANGALLASDSTGLYMCGNNVIQQIPFGGSLGINQLNGDVVAGPCTGSCASTVTRIGGGTILSTFTGPLQNNAGTIVQQTNFNLPGFGQVGTYFRDGLNTVAFSSTPVFNLALGNTQLITLTGDVTSSTFSNPPGLNASQPVRMWVCEDGTGGHKFNYPTVIQGITPVTLLANQCTSLFVNVVTTGAGTTYIADNFNTENCISAASPAVCDQATIGEIAIPTGTNPTLQINTTAWQAHSQLLFAPDQTKAADLGITCNTALPVGRYEVTGGSAGVDVVVTWVGTVSTNALCGTYTIRNP